MMGVIPNGRQMSHASVTSVDDEDEGGTKDGIKPMEIDSSPRPKNTGLGLHNRTSCSDKNNMFSASSESIPSRARAIVMESHEGRVDDRVSCSDEDDTIIKSQAPPSRRAPVQVVHPAVMHAFREQESIEVGSPRCTSGRARQGWSARNFCSESSRHGRTSGLFARRTGIVPTMSYTSVVVKRANGPSHG
ncbi:hypothetical protein CNMCM5793_006039 [Aspergillus hiratsukae]|uniref:Uncharacterized protein n=1 Tax=Aspergillus hiratsukae TaxID=1194566 RepID=A0A8H6PGR9_9EURO|nr:hypothetical protein CNMCM5793_006039 [Aspergillus hiratsukae]KAF7173869.1 hypothetical protein CNMCM6106_007959 [Aspergillus hiratsukae]